MTSTVITLMNRVLGATFPGETWTTWRAVLKAAHALDLTVEHSDVEDDLAILIARVSLEPHAHPAVTQRSDTVQLTYPLSPPPTRPMGGSDP